MLDIKFIQENLELVKKGTRDKGFDELSVNELLEFYEKAYLPALSGVEKLRGERNRLAQEKNIEKGKELKEKLTLEEQKLKECENELNEKLLKIPAPPKPDVKYGKNDSENEVVRKVGKITKFDFSPKDHLDLGTALDIIDVERAAKVSGARFAYLKNEGALLEIALVRLAFDILISKGFIPIIPPALIKKDVMRSLGYSEFGGDEDMFFIPSDGLNLIGTAEHTIVAMHKDEVFDGNKLPVRYVGFSPAFRREAGSYGKDTKGILRVHQFDKVEMVSFVEEGFDDKEHEFLLSLEEEFFQMLKIPYQVVKMCSGDLGFPVSRKYDIEAWMPGQNKYREVTSTSTTTDFQSRGLNIKYQDQNIKKFTFILNGTAYAIGRTIISILENFQQADGSVKIPDILIPYTGFSEISVK